MALRTSDQPAVVGKKLPIQGRLWRRSASLVGSFLVAVFLLFSGFIIPNQGWQISLWLGLTGGSLERFLFLVPILYGGWYFGIRVGAIIAGASLAAMLVQAYDAGYGNMADAVFQSIMVTIIGAGGLAVSSVWRRNERQYVGLIEQLEVVRDQLQANIRKARSSEIRLAALNRITVVLTQTLDFQQVLRNAIEAVMEVMQVEVALIFSLNEDTGELKLVAYEGVSQEFVLAIDRLLVAEGLIGQVARTGETLYVQDASTDPRVTRPEVRKMKLRAELMVPLKYKGKSVGVLVVAMRRPRQFLPEEVELLTVIANQIGVAMENARLYQEQRLNAEKLFISEQNYRSLFEKAHDAIWVHDLDGTIIAANEADMRLTGFKERNLIGRNVTEFLSPDSLELARKVRQKLLVGEPFPQPYEQKVMHSDGSFSTVMLTSSIIVREGQPTTFQHIARDVTEEKRMQDNLRYYVQQITRAQEEERKRIARELHDDTSQALYALSRHLDNFQRDHKSLADADARFISELKEQVASIQAGVRRFSQDLRPSIIDDLGLLPALRWLTREMANWYGVETTLTVVGGERRFAPDAELLVFRIIQEGLRNVGKHSGATVAGVMIEFGDGRTVIDLSDNGKGFALPDTIGDLSRIGKLGLVGMQERVALLNGSLKVHSEKGKGTTLTIEIPL